MKKSTKGIAILATLMLVAFVSADDGPDPAYFKTFGYGSIAASIEGRPSYDTYNPSQFDYRDGIFYIPASATRVDLRALLPKGQTYGSMLNALFTEKNSLLKDKKDDGSIYWYAWSSHEYDGTRIYPEWKQGSAHPDYHNKRVWETAINIEPAKTWNSSACYFDDPNETSLKTDVINTWLKMAKPGFQLYILNTVGFQRWVKEASYWDYGQGKQVTPLEYVLSDKYYSYCILQIE
jgi:hypothetical protein